VRPKQRLQTDRGAESQQRRLKGDNATAGPAAGVTGPFAAKPSAMESTSGNTRGTRLRNATNQRLQNTAPTLQYNASRVGLSNAPEEDTSLRLTFLLDGTGKS